MNRIEKFRHLFPPLRQIFPSSCGHQSFDQEIKKCRKAYVSSISALYPGRDLNPHARDEHRILSPNHFPEIPVKSELSALHFKAKCDISALKFRPSPTFYFLRIHPTVGVPIFLFLQTIKNNRHGNNK